MDPETEVIETPVPAGEGEISPTEVETEAQGQPTTPEDHDEIADLKEAVEAADSPEAKAKAQSALDKAYRRAFYDKREARREKEEAEERARKAELEAAELRGRAEEWRKVQTQQATEPVREEGPILPPVPRKEDYKDEYGDVDQDRWVEAMAQHARQSATAEWEWRTQKAEAKRQQEQFARERQSWVNQGEEKFPGFIDKTMTLQSKFMALGEMGNTISQAISSSQKSHELAIYLANNPQEISKLAALDPFRAVMAIGQMELKLEKPKPKTTTEAPEPIVPVTSANATQVADEDLETADFIARRNKQEFGDKWRG